MTKTDLKRVRKRFDALKAFDPRLQLLEQEVRDHAARNRDTLKYCANAWWYGYGYTNINGFDGFKSKVHALVGRYAHDQHDPRLQDDEALTDVTDHLYYLLPDCRPGCACQTLQHPGKENVIL